MSSRIGGRRSYAIPEMVECRCGARTVYRHTTNRKSICTSPSQPHHASQHRNRPCCHRGPTLTLEMNRFYVGPFYLHYLLRSREPRGKKSKSLENVSPRYAMRDNSWKEESLKSYYHPIIHFRFQFPIRWER